ncbi:MAG: DNA mismatch repair endonuclease MutL, partial [Clostridia bacterium]
RSAVAAVFGPDRAQRALTLEGSALGGAITVTGLILPPDLARGNRSAQVLSVNGRLVRNFGLRFAIEQAYGTLIPDRRYPQFFVALTLDPADVDPNAHPTKAEVRFAHERAIQGVVRQAVADALRMAPAFPLVTGAADRAWEGAAPPYGLVQEDWLAEGQAAAKAGPVLHTELAGLVPVGQWALRYVLAQGAEALYVIDQHAAQERIFYDQLRQRAAEPAYSQPLLEPLRLTLTPSEEALLERAAQALQSAGFRWISVGASTILIQEVPVLLADGADLRLGDQVLASLSAGETGEHPVSWALDHRLATAACKAAVKANRPLSFMEMGELLAAMARTENPRACPHGRPVILSLTLDQVDRHFGRR